jgi:O-antigen/teichoic acid export membrane protein
VAPPAVVGFYDLGYSLPQMGLELLPLSLYAVVMSAVTASYHRDPSRLGHLVGWMYKLLAVTTVPFALLGFVWADKLVALLYGAKMAPAGWIAQAYSLIHLLPFVSLPIGIALNVVEKAHKTLLFGFVQAGVALGLDLLLIPRFKVPGAIAAVLLSVLLVTPVTIWYAVKQTGPLEFPWRWMGRLALVLAPGLLPGLARPWVNGWAGVVACVAASGVLMLLGIRWGGVIGSEERYRLLRAPIPGRRHVLRILGVAP